jgi:DNA-binding NarL/FixJ family response regulator
MRGGECYKFAPYSIYRRSSVRNNATIYGKNLTGCMKEFHLRVLLVDDNEKFIETLAGYIETFPSVQIVGKARSGEEAVNLTSKLKPDLILMDIQMPGLSGFETTRLLKASENPPRILLLSFNNSPLYKSESIKAGADGYLVKSEINSGLLRTISSIIPLNPGAVS